MIKKLIATTIIIGMTTSLMGCKANKASNVQDESNNNPKEVVEVVKDKNEDKNKELKLGNSINNILSGGLVAYDDKYMYYREEDANHESYLYKKNIKTNEVKELVKESAMCINIYKDYIYYVDSVGAMIPTNEIKRVKNDGSELEVIVSKNENADSRGVQIIGDFLYYAVYVDGNADTATKMDLMKMNLKTLEKSKLATLDKGEIISVNNNGTIETYVKPYNPSNWIFTNIVQSKEDEDFEVNILDISDKKISSIIGVYNNELYYETLDSLNSSKVFKSSIEGIDSKEEFVSEQNISLDEKKSLVGKDSIYFLSDLNKIKILNLKTDKIDDVKEVDMRMPFAQRDDLAFVLSEVKGNLAYYNQEGKLIVDNSIDINEESYSNNSTYNDEKENSDDNIIDTNDKKDEEFDIFNPNRKLTVEEAKELAYYRVGDRITDDGKLTELDGRECFRVIYTYRENGVDLLYVDLNTGEINIEKNEKWQKYTKTKEELEIGGPFGWEYVD